MKSIHRDKTLESDLKHIENRLNELIGEFSISFPDGHKENLEEVVFLEPSKFRKFDAIINGKRFRIRCISYYNNPLVNHTSRDKYIYICNKLGLSIEELDKTIDEYWSLRLKGIIGEDIDNSSPDCPFRKHKDYLSKILTWFAFNSLTPVSGIIENSCDYILDFEDPKDEQTWRVYGKEDFIDSIWKHLRFSLRDKKGMPADYDPEDSKFDIIKPWVRRLYGRDKGALHIRINAGEHFNAFQPSFEKANEEIISTVSKNQGERDERLVKLYLVHLRMNSIPLTIGGETMIINSLGNTPNDEYRDLPCDIEWNTISAVEIVSISKMVKADKSNSRSKSDVFINKVGISIKSIHSAPPTIVNQTRRGGMLRVINLLNLEIHVLDGMVKEYWEKRMSGEISEDILSSNKICPFLNIEYLKPILTYFAFIGTGSADSLYPAEKILTVSNPTDPSTWETHDRNNFIPSVWDRLQFSLRTKGVPQLKNGRLPVYDDVDKPWLKPVTGRDGTMLIAGAFNVRVR